MNKHSEAQNLDNIVDVVRNTSFLEKQSEKTEEELINSFLDSINDLKKELREKSKNIHDISEKIEALTWLKNRDTEVLGKLNELIVLAKDVHATLIRKYVSLNYFRQTGIAKDETIEFKQAIDFFKEAYTDIESAFFIFPKNNEFVEITKNLEK